MRLGSHLSIAGGLDRALVRAAEYGFSTVAMFLCNQRQWRAGPLSDEAVSLFRRTRRRLGISPVVAHGSYLVNLAGEAPVRRKSIAATADQLDRCGRLGIEYLVIHPGSCRRKQLGIDRIAAALNAILARCPHRRPKVLLETTAGAGHHIGSTFEELSAILAKLDRPRRFGVCLDTCHVFAAGYDLRTPKAYRRTMTALDHHIGLGRLKVIHLNDSLGPCGSHVDRHAHIGKGRIGREGFAHLLGDRRLREIPMILETPKGRNKAGTDWDRLNARTIRRLARARPARSAR